MRRPRNKWLLALNADECTNGLGSIILTNQGRVLRQLCKAVAAETLRLACLDKYAGVSDAELIADAAQNVCPL